jgi:hypothetical protein
VIGTVKSNGLDNQTKPKLIKRKQTKSKQKANVSKKKQSKANKTQIT